MFSAISNCHSLKTLRFGLELTNNEWFPGAFTAVNIGSNADTKFEQCLKKLKNLEVIQIGPRFNCLLSSGVFQGLDSLQSLQHLRTRVVNDHWIDDVLTDHYPSPDRTPFGNLQALDAQLHEKGIRILLPCLLHLRVLKLQGVTSTLLDALGEIQLNRLERLRLYLDKKSPITLSHLRIGTRALGNLRDLKISGGDRLTTVKSKESLMDDIFQRFPKLTKVYLDIGCLPPFTHISIIWLGRHCPYLQECTLFGSSVTSGELVKEAGSIGWPNLKVLNQKKSYGQRYYRTSHEYAKEIVVDLRRLMPRLDRYSNSWD